MHQIRQHITARAALIRISLREYGEQNAPRAWKRGGHVRRFSSLVGARGTRREQVAHKSTAEGAEYTPLTVLSSVESAIPTAGCSTLSQTAALPGHDRKVILPASTPAFELVHHDCSMASNASFDVSTGADLQEVDNAVNQTLKEIAQRYDFKGTHCEVNFDREKAEIRLSADDEYRMEALVDVLKTKMIKRNVPVKNLDLGEIEQATGQTVRRTLKLTQGIPQDAAKRIVKAVKDQGFKKVQTAIQGDELRVTAPSRDELQTVIAFLRSQDFGIELKFGNYRG
jgi:uncharacterized protein YajQ (UPF0234 family)